MAEVLVQFDTVLTSPAGVRYQPRACARPSGGVWEGWIEFAPVDGDGDALRTARETEQPNRDDTLYWAQGLTEVYLEGALRRAIAPPAVRHDREVALSSMFDGPAPSEEPPTGAPLRRTTLDPFLVYQQGEDVLVKELAALDVPRLRDIVLAYGFASPDRADGAPREELTALILAGVRRPLRVDPQPSPPAP